ncbi:MAG: hypothetical protein JSS30_01470 [Verrucomicrobia bacterium]|nr:hypothetical protein [Verrucomicrobiota bacterium]
MLKKTLIILASSAPFFGYANTETNVEEQCCPLIPSKPIESCQLPVGYLYPGAYDLPGCLNISFYGEFLYLEFNRDGTSNIGLRIENLPTEINNKVLVHQAGYKPAFKVGASTTLPGCDQLLFNVEYFQYHNTTTNHFGTNTNEVITLRAGAPNLPALPQIAASSLRSQVKLHLDRCCAYVGRPTYFSERFLLNPFFGLNSWWSSQDVNLTFSFLNGQRGTSFTKSGFWGIGPYVGINAKGLLWCGIYMIGNIGTSFMFNSFNKYRVVNNFPTANYLNTETIGRNPSNYWLIHIMLENALGIGWGSYLCDQAYHVDFGISYYTNTSYLLSYVFSRGNPTREFYYQGLSVRGQFDF